MNRDIRFSWVRRLKFKNKYTLPELIYGFNVIPIKTPTGVLFLEPDKLTLTFKQNNKGPRIGKTTSEKDSGEGFALLDTRTYV